MSLPKFRVALRGEALLTHPRFNKGTAFTASERKAFGLTGKLPYRINSLDEQCQRAYDQLQSQTTDIGKNSFLQSMKDQNWVLFYSLLTRHLRELIPIIYTPTEAEAIANYSHLFRRSEGLYLTFANRDTMEEDFLEATKGKSIDLFVSSDAEAILGIGDQGVGGIGISAAKSVIYSLIGGIDPSKAIAVTLDVGTNNESLLNDPLYVGWPHERIRGKEYDDFVDKFVQLVRKYFPHSLLHFEDYGVTNAQRLLQRYRNTHAVFNDDIQGTGAVTLSTLMAAIGVTKSKLCDQRIIIYGAGSAGLGIAKQLRDAMVSINNIPVEEANAHFWLIDKHGLIRESLPDVRDDLKEYVRKDAEWEEFQSNGDIKLLDVVKKVKPTVMIGTSTHAGGFTKEVVEAMAAGCDRPIIFPLSNPSRLVEVDPRDANDWTKGKALLATGSPFPPAKMPNGKDYIIAECNNALIYPGLGFGSMISQSRIMTDTMIIAGARRLASLSPALKDPDDALLPDFGDAPSVNFEVAVAVAEQAIEEGSAGVDWKKEEVREKAKERLWQPIYGEYVYDENGDK
ncbi:NAD-dependent malic enzyme 3 [Lentinula edodes]|uniref:Malic enzyme n=1 Tax=Lentinula edodes TaxID=5353 RepID=A0A1Q3EH72_LENED|nr:NAD-dependent malic enzyme 3 [Lentinula edodes]